MSIGIKLVCFSDTHKKHSDVVLPQGDVAVFAGDMCGNGSSKSARKFINWFSAQPHRYKVMIAGNHDRCFESSESSIIELFVRDNGIFYLKHRPVMISGIKFFGSPYQPEFCNWAFNIPRGEHLARYWSQIPDDTQVLITHSPPYGILDATMEGLNVGCEDLRKRINQLTSLKVHIFGHIHYSYGTMMYNNVTCVNACICNESYVPINKPQTVII